MVLATTGIILWDMIIPIVFAISIILRVDTVNRMTIVTMETGIIEIPTEEITTVTIIAIIIVITALTVLTKAV